MTPLQFYIFLTDNERGELVNSSDGTVKELILQAMLTRTVDPTSPTVQAALGELFTPDRATEFQAYVASLPAPADPVATLTTAGFTAAQAAAIVAVLPT